MRLLERDVDRRFVTGLKRLGLTSIKLSALGAYGTSGWPDRLVLLGKGRVLFIELKAPGGKVSPLQAHRQAELRKLGYTVETCDDAKKAIDHVRRALG